MMSWFGKLIGTDKALDIVQDTAKSTFGIIDNAFYTDQEKTQDGIAAKNKATELWLDSQALIIKQSSGTSVSRRIIAWSVISIVIFMLLQVSLAAWLVPKGYISATDSDAIIASLMSFADKFSIGWAFVGVIVFYFGAHVMEAKKK